MHPEKRIGFFVSGIGLLAIISNILRAYYVEAKFIKIFIKNPDILILFASTLFLFVLTVLSFRKIKKVNQFFQYILFIATGTISTLDNYESWYGLGLFALAIILGYKYGFYEKNKIIKIIITSFYIFVIFELSSIIHPNSSYNGYGLEALIYLLFFFGVLFLCHYDELSLKMNNMESLRREKDNIKLKMQKDSLRVTELECQIETLEKSKESFDLSKCMISPAEMKVLECLVQYNARNAEIGEKLNKAEDTVKVQMRSIFDKVGVETRYQLIDLCRNNFLRK